MYYGFEYFCGANVTIRVGQFILLEAAGISYDYQNSKRPIYGYSSIHYDGVANGQALVTGSLIINYVHEDYLFRLLEMHAGIPEKFDEVNPDYVSSQDAETAFLADQENALSADSKFVEDRKKKYWDAPGNTSTAPLHNTFSPVDLIDGVDIKIVFGDQDTEFSPSGKTGVLLEDVHFTGASKVVRISEETIVEVYPFFARNRYSLRNNTQVVTQIDPTASNPNERKITNIT